MTIKRFALTGLAALVLVAGSSSFRPAYSCGGTSPGGCRSEQGQAEHVEQTLLERAVAWFDSVFG